MNRLKNPIYTLLLITICLLSSCGHREDITVAQLLRAEAVMDEHPDSALTIIMAVDSSALATPADSALYNLLLTQGQVRTDQGEPQLNRVSGAMMYFMRHPDNDRRLMLSMLYSAILMDRKGLYSQAIVPLLRAEQLAIDNGEYFYLGLIDREISDVYQCTYDMPASLDYAHRAWEAFKNSGKRKYANYEQMNYALSLICNQKYSEAVPVAARAEKCAREMKDTIALRDALRAGAMGHMGVGDTQEAIKLYEEAMTMFNEPDSEDLQRMIILYNRIGQTRKADSLYSRLSQRGADYFAPMHARYAAEHKYQEAYRELMKLVKHYRKAFTTAESQRVSQTVIDFKNQEIVQKENNLRQKNRLILSVIGFALVITIALVWIMYYRKKAARIENEKLILQLELLQQDLIKTSSRHSIDIQTFLQQRIDYLNAMFAAYNAASPDNRPARLTGLLDSIARSLRQTPAFTRSILSEIDLLYSGLISDLKKADTTLSDTDLKILCFFYAGFSTSSIAVILSGNSNMVYVRKSRLKAKIAALDFPRKDELLELLK